MGQRGAAFMPLHRSATDHAWFNFKPSALWELKRHECRAPLGSPPRTGSPRCPAFECSIARRRATPFTAAVQFDFLQRLASPAPKIRDFLMVESKPVPVQVVRHRQARRYILRVKADGSARITVPPGGSRQAALEFARRHAAWIAEQLEKRRQAPARASAWRPGTLILFRGEQVSLTAKECLPGTEVHFADQKIVLPGVAEDLRPIVEQHLQQLAAVELTVRTLELAKSQDLEVRRVTVRSQRSRWGSCSIRRTVSLNWRLIQTPPFVRDYIILHELTHLREMNHSERFWKSVEQTCPEYQQAEEWLRRHNHLLRDA